MNCIIVDDEPLAREGIRILIEKTAGLSLLKSFSNAHAASAFLSSSGVDLVFLDIQMPGASGLEFARTIPAKTLIIFTTAYAEYALDSYEVEAIDYLLKPIHPERFQKAITKALAYQKLLETSYTGDPANPAHNADPTDPAYTTDAAGAHASPISIAHLSDPAGAPNPSEPFVPPGSPNAPAEAAAGDYFFVKADRKIFKVCFGDILFIEGLKDYVVLHTPDQKIITAINIKTIHEQLPQALFVRVSKSYIINVKQIDSFDNNTIFIRRQEIPIGNSYRDFFFGEFVAKKLLSR